MTNNQPERSPHNRGTKRRQFIKAVGATAGIGAVTDVVSARQPIDALASTTPPKVQASSSHSGGTDLADQPDIYEGTSVTGEQNMTVYRWKGSVSGGGISVPVDQSSSMTTYNTSSKDLVENVDHSTVEISWNTNGPGTIAKTDAKERNTGMHPSSGSGDYSLVDSAIEIGHQNFLGALAEGVAGPIYAPAELVAQMVANWHDHNKTQESLTREFSYTYEEVGSNWTEYKVTVDPGKQFDIAFANITSILGMGSMVSFVSVGIKGETTTSAAVSPRTISTMSASEAEKNEIDVYHIKAVKQNPEAFGITEEFLKDYDREYLYQVPVETTVNEQSNSLPDGFIERNRETVEEHHPDLL